MNDTIRISSWEDQDRFARFRLISWWDQHRLSQAKVLVIGAGALGNEILKNLALLGVGNVLVADLDTVENSNLSRSVLFRAEDCGRPKVEVAAERARDIFPDQKLQTFHGNVVYDLGLGAYRWADIILGGLDNREARVAINQAASKLGKVWIDGAIERLEGVARVFDPADGPCYECTMSDIDWKMLQARRSCALLARDEMEQGKVPTTPTTSAVIAGIQTQEAVKYLHGMPVLRGQGFIFDGMHHQNYVVTYARNEDCAAHEAFSEIVELDWSTATTKAGKLLARVRADLGADAVIETNQDLLASLYCPKCDHWTPHYASLGKITEAHGRCPQCSEPRTPKFYHTICDTDEAVLDRTLEELGIPPWDILTGRSGLDELHYAFNGDRTRVLGPLS